jgi:hypothetical protein
MILPNNDSATLQTQPLIPEQRQGRTITSRTIFWIGFKDRKDDDASNDLLLRIAAGAAHAKRGVGEMMMQKQDNRERETKRDGTIGVSYGKRILLMIPPSLWGVILLFMFADIREFNQRSVLFRGVCISDLFASPLVAIYTVCLLVFFVRRRDVIGIALTALLLIPLAGISFFTLGILIYGVPLQT